MARIVLAGSEPEVAEPDQVRTKVLVVDDDPGIRNLVSMLLATEGFEVVGESVDGNEGVQMAMSEQPDFVVLDYMMPGIDGEETARFIRATCPEAQIIGFSGAMRSAPEWCDHFLYKGDVSKLPELISDLVAS